MIQALGGRLLDRHGQEIGLGGGSLSELADIDLSGLDVRLKHVKIEVACDVDNPLTGPKGASAVFGPQKGATPEMVATLDKNLHHYADVIERVLGKQVKDIPGAGAAGGLGAGLLAFLEAELKRGVEIVLETVKFHERIQDASLVITGEGRIDGQTIFGKTPIGVAKAAKRYNIPVIAIAGSVSDDSDVVLSHGIDALYSIVPGIIPLEKALANAEYYVTKTARNIAAACNIGRKMN
jgi:glycerate 2-kinase